MKLYYSGVIILYATLSGCITTTSGNMGTPPDKEEAARLNMDLGIGYLNQGEYEQAETKLLKSIAEEPNNPGAHRALGYAYEMQSDSKSAEKEYSIAIKQGPDDPDALNQYATFKCTQGDVKEALKYYDRAIEIPRNSNLYVLYTNAGTCAKASDLSLAENYLRKSLSLNNSFPDTLYQMADVTYQRDKFLQSRAFVERRLAVAPATSGLLWLAYRVELALNDMQAADRFARRLMYDFPESLEAGFIVDSQRDAR
jgi:type IV pilus assembly protein PilF